ncbi:CRISPR-associated protein, Cas5e family [Marinobacter persicus]|uniref:CRISPR-associated protein, Cas5e family n=1 Tax=Marinobacter persicus TaxID=930118 RepID=A0A1I3UJ54_9GAMM|nr:type I-E CRISPR-associated protein Cas5/CasD [Marinobacter persicus]GHD52609.1 type I-E CRISPR-associated protein Cas5/CasD [Marinobacter persicus]SFJ81777.1 CRISPR-associated protein, Cas5e family [Marinobacter persicus]
MDVLVFQLYGPLASWGAPAVGESRPSSDHPGRSALLGLLAAALGIERDDAPNQQALANSVRFSVKQLAPGNVIRDFHTVQVPKRNKKAQYATRKEEIGFTSDRLNTIISRREYRCDGFWRVGVALSDASDWSLAELQTALQKPKFTLYLGRKSCPLAVPLLPKVVQADGIRQALDTDFPALHERQRQLLDLGDVVDFYWEGEGGDIEPQDTRYPEDEVVSRSRWQFRGRREHHARIKEVR